MEKKTPTNLGSQKLGSSGKRTSSLKIHLQNNIFCHFKFYYNKIIGICQFYRRQQKCNLFSDLTFGSIHVKAHPLYLIDTFGCLCLVVKADRTEVTYYEFQERKRIQISVVYSVETVVLFFDFTLVIKGKNTLKLESSVYVLACQHGTLSHDILS